MTDTLLTTCAICPAKTAKLCGGCQSISFCSKEHQKLIWSTHKYACKNGGVWTTKPLTAEEVEVLSDWRSTVSMEWLGQCLRRCKDYPGPKVVNPNQEKDFTVVEKIKRLALWDGKWEDLLEDLARPSPAIQDPERSAILSLIRHRLTGCSSVRSAETGESLGQDISNAIAHKKKLRLTPWNHMCETAMRFVEPVNMAQDVQLEPGLKLFQQSYPFFQQMLTAHTLTFAFWDIPSLSTRRYAYLAFDRAHDMLRDMILPEPLRVELEDFIRRTRGLVDEGEWTAGLPEALCF